LQKEARKKRGAPLPMKSLTGTARGWQWEWEWEREQLLLQRSLFWPLAGAFACCNNGFAAPDPPAHSIQYSSLPAHLPKHPRRFLGMIKTWTDKSITVSSSKKRTPRSQLPRPSFPNPRYRQSWRGS
jgi:hypothetical protein